MTTNRQPKTPKVSGYFAHMDGLRALAITLVMIEHFGGMLPVYFPAGYYGVDLFFVISGFLITSILVGATGKFGDAYKTFMGRRVLRIFPVYYLALGILFFCDFANTRQDIGWLLTYTWNYVAVVEKPPLFYLWSLSVEEQFYLFWPLLVLTLRRRPILLLGVTLTIVTISYGQLVLELFPALTTYDHTGLINRMGSLGLGAAAAIAYSRNWIPRWLFVNRTLEILTWLCLAGALAGRPGPWLLPSAFADIRFPVMGLCSTVLVLKSVGGDFSSQRLRTALSHPTSILVGRVSYGIYVYHWPLALALNEVLFDPIWLGIDFSALGPLEKLRWHSWLVRLPLYYALTLGVAYVSYRYFERPLLRLKNLWFPASGPKPVS